MYQQKIVNMISYLRGTQLLNTGTLKLILRYLKRKYKENSSRKKGCLFISFHVISYSHNLFTRVVVVLHSPFWVVRWLFQLFFYQLLSILSTFFFKNIFSIFFLFHIIYIHACFQGWLVPNFFLMRTHLPPGSDGQSFKL